MSSDRTPEKPLSQLPHNASPLGFGGSNSYDEEMFRNSLANTESSSFLMSTTDSIYVSNAPRSGLPFNNQLPQLPQVQQQQQSVNPPANYPVNMLQSTSSEQQQQQHGTISPHSQMNYTGQTNSFPNQQAAGMFHGQYTDNNYSNTYGEYAPARQPPFYPLSTRTGNLVEQGNISNYKPQPQQPQQQQMDFIPRQAWAPLHTNDQMNSVPGQRKSLGETHAPPPQNYVRQHRRGRSDEACIAYSSVKDSMSFASPPGRLFHSPPPERNARFPIHLSRSTTSLIENPPHMISMRYNQNTNTNRLPHSMSVDSPGMLNAQVINEMLFKQNTVYVNLTTSIKFAQRKLNELESEVIDKEKELNRLLSVQKNPTEKEYLQMKKETGILHREIEEMYQECDRLEISISPDDERPRDPGAVGPILRPLPAPPHTPSPTKHHGNPNNPFARPHQMYPPPRTPSPGTIHRTPQPGPVIEQPPPYHSIADPVPKYGSINNRYPPGNHPPPPIPPRPVARVNEVGSEDSECLSESEYWECPSCTFKNLLVGECEVCYTPRPATATRHP